MRYLEGIASAEIVSPERSTSKCINNLINVGAADEASTVTGIDLRSANLMAILKSIIIQLLMNEMTSTLVSYGIGNSYKVLVR